MRNFSIAVLAALLLVSCTQGARVDITLQDAPKSQVVVRQLDLNVYKTLDTLCTNADGKASYTVPVQEGQPEFVYLFYKNTKIASLLLHKGDAVSVSADTLGHFEVSGSPESQALAGVEAAASRFGASMQATDDLAELSRLYVEHYRECMRYVMSNQRSLTVVPVLFEQLDVATPLFSQYTDAILFRQTVDTLKTVYPESRYVKALEKETVRRENALAVNNMVSSAPQLGYPDISLPGIDGQKQTLSSIESKAVLVHFWDSSEAAQKMFNLDVLIPIWEKWHAKGFQIYAVDVNPDKSAWASVVKAQKLPWVNVNGGVATAQAVSLYNVSEVPSSFFLVDGALSSATISGADGLSKELAKVL